MILRIIKTDMILIFDYIKLFSVVKLKKMNMREIKYIICLRKIYPNSLLRKIVIKQDNVL